MSDLNAKLLRQECEQQGLEWRVEVADEIPSTNDALRQAAAAGAPHGQVLFAESQSAGRGRRDNRWISSRGRDLIVSFLLRPAASMSLWPRITTLAALGVCHAIEEELPLRPTIKWPNDVYVNGRKVCGLLAETVHSPAGQALILGIGLNVNSHEFPPTLAETATSLLQAMPAGVQVRELDRQALALQLLKALSVQLGRLENGFEEAVQEVRQRAWLTGKQIRATADGLEIFGRVLDLDHEGHLQLALPDGSVRILSSADNVRQVI